MKKIGKNIYTVTHNLILIDKGYEFLSLFLKGNNNILCGTQINKIHIFISKGVSAYRTFEMLNNIAKDSKAKIIVHISSDFLTKVMNTFKLNHDKGKDVYIIFINNKQKQEFIDDAGTLTVNPYSFMKVKEKEYSTISHGVKNTGKKEKSKK